MNFINLTPHPIKLNDGRVFEPTGQVARVSATFTEAIGDICSQEFGQVENVPEPVQGTKYIVSNIVLQAAKAQGRTDLVAPATGHPNTIRNEKGWIVSVPCFVD